MRIIWQTVRRITNEILGVKGFKGLLTVHSVQYNFNFVVKAFSFLRENVEISNCCYYCVSQN